MLKIGVITETRTQQYYLSQVIKDTGYQLVCGMLTADVIVEMNQVASQVEVDAWIVNADLDNMGDDASTVRFRQWLSELEKPVILGDGYTHGSSEDGFSCWSRRVKGKLLALPGQMRLDTQATVKARHVWVLAASTGGPEAVKSFLDIMPVNMDIGFIYAQHIDQTQHRVLRDVVVRDSDYCSFIGSHGDIVSCNSVVIIPAKCQVDIQHNGSLVLYKDRSWRGVYRPSIDQVVANVASCYGRCSGVIFFTGMGSDGSAGCRLMSLHGGQVWAQSPSTCIAPSMPKEAIDTGYVNKIDTPENLALHLKVWVTQIDQNHH